MERTPAIPNPELLPQDQVLRGVEVDYEEQAGMVRHMQSPEESTQGLTLQEMQLTEESTQGLTLQTMDSVEPQEGRTLQEEGVQQGFLARTLERAGDFARDKTPRKLTAGIAVAVIAVAGAAKISNSSTEKATAAPTPAKQAGASTSANADTTVTPHYIKRRSKLQPQPFLNKIAYKTYPLEKVVKAKPLRASVSPEKIAYNNSCKPSSRDGAIFKHFARDRTGVGYRTCGPVLIMPDQIRPSRQNEYQSFVNMLGNRTLKSVGLRNYQKVNGLHGNRKKLTVRYQCPDEVVTTGIPGNVEQIVLRRARKGSRATIKRCS